MNKCVHPVKENVVHCCTEETVQHVHPSHTTVKKHHIVKNEHVYPHSTSVENSVDCVDVNCGGWNQNGHGQPPRPGNQMGGANHYGKHPGMHHGMNHGMNHSNKHNKWC